MRNVVIDEAQTILESFWDCGESYSEHQKYSCIQKYNVTCKGNAECNIQNSWFGVLVKITGGENNDDSVLERKCDIDISGYDIIRLFAGIPANVSVKLYVTTEKGEILAFDENGRETVGEYSGKISGNRLYGVKIVFSAGAATSILLYLGMANEKALVRLESRKSPYDSKWEGCFKENKNIDYVPQKEIFFTCEELSDIRNKIKKEPFLSAMNKIRAKAYTYMNIVPEASIGNFAPGRDDKNNIRFIGRTDLSKTDIIQKMIDTAFVGIVDKQKDKLHMACRMALSLAHCSSWDVGIMGTFPGATWHHRSFEEEVCLRASAAVLDWAGMLLTWHGEHIIEDAMIMKGLPRIEADFNTVDYIRYMNQGIVFSGGRIAALIELSRNYPRYKEKISDAEGDLIEMVENYICDDGGITEGPSYWNYSFSNAMQTFMILSSYHKKTLDEYLTPKIKNTLNYGLCMLSDIKDNTYMLNINDAKNHRYNSLLASVYSQLNPYWNGIYKRMLENKNEAMDIWDIIYCTEVKGACADLADKMIALTDVGQCSVRNNIENIGSVHLHTVSGPTSTGHNHGDKGSFILEVDKIPVFIDRGVPDYGVVYPEIAHSQMHNLFIPADISITQPFSSGGGCILENTYNEAGFRWKSELCGAWNKGMFTSLRRTVTSRDLSEIVIEDYAKSDEEMQMCFILNSYNEFTVKDGGFVLEFKSFNIIITCENYIDYTIDNTTYDENMCVVNRLRLMFEKNKETNSRVTIKIVV